MKQFKVRSAHARALLAAMATLGGSAALHAQSFPFKGINFNESRSFTDTVAALNSLSIGTLPAEVNTVITNLQGYKTSEETKKAGLVSVETAARGLVSDKALEISAKDLQITEKQAEIDTKAAQITSLIATKPLDPQIAVEQANLATLQAGKVTLQGEKTALEGDLGTLNANLTVASNDVLNSTIKIALYDQVLAPTTGTVDQAKAAAAAVAADVAKARDQFASGGIGDNATATGASGLQSVIDKLQLVSAGDPAPVVAALNTADTNFQAIGAENASIADIQALVGEINTQLPALPPISESDREAAVFAVLNGSYERNAIDTIQSNGIAGIAFKDGLGRTHIGTNSLIVDDTAAAGAGNINLTANDSNGDPAKITVATDFGVTGATTTNGITNTGAISTDSLTVGSVAAATVNDVAAETTRATNAEGVLQTNINTEATTRAAADTTLQNNIDSEVAARVADVNAEEARALAAEGVLQTNINAEATTRAAADVVLQNNINAEAATRAAADTTLQNNIDSEVAARVADVNAEEARALAAEGVLQTNINTEATTRAAADVVLQTNINAEAATRAAADTTLQANIDAEVANRIADVNAEETRARAAEVALAGRATALETRATSLEGRASALEGRMGRAESDIRSLRKGIAMAAALQTPAINDGDKMAVKVGAATYDGEQGLGVGFAAKVSDSVTVNVDASTGFPAAVVRGGVNLSF